MKKFYYVMVAMMILTAGHPASGGSDPATPSDSSESTKKSVKKSLASKTATAEDDASAAPKKPCITPFGTKLGNANGVVGYSNCNTDTISHESNEESGQLSGMKWQCVEYARRYMQKKLGVTFGDVHGAQNIWFLTAATLLKDDTTVSFFTVPNGSSEAPPTVGSLLIYPLSEECPFGHVAVVVKVDVAGDSVHIAEQNWDSKKWPGDGSHSRTVKLEKNANGKYVLTDASGLEILGWKTIGGVQSPHEAE